MGIVEKRVQVADLISRGVKPDEIARQVGYKDAKSVYQAVASSEVKEQIAWHRDNLFEQARIDRVKLLRELYQRATEPTGPIFKILRGDGDFLDAANLEKLHPFQSRLIQQIEIEPTMVKCLIDGKPETITASVVKKIRFHSPDSALKILSKAAGFEDGVLANAGQGEGGPFRGLIIIPPGSEPIDVERSGEGPPENPISVTPEGSDS